MAGIAVAEDVVRLARDAHLTKVESGHYGRLMGWAGASLGKVAKACGATEAQVQSWISGEAEPTVAQYLALCEALRPRRVASLNGASVRTAAV